MATIQSISFSNFKRFSRFSLACKETNIIVGPNNAGKSTILDAFRLFRDVYRFASRNNPQLREQSEIGVCASYRMPPNLIGIPIENVVRDYGDDPAKIEIRLSNDSRLHVWLHPNESVNAFVQTDRALPRTATDFRRLFPVELVIVPTLSALEEREPTVKAETASRNENTRLASRNFRNILYGKTKQEFEEFVKLCREGWTDIDIEPPEIVRGDPSYLTMMYVENRIPREIYWSGFGFQVWMQMMAHFMRATPSAVLVLDEPDIYLHPELQKKILRMAKSKFCQTFIATHSTEIMNEADPGDILSVVPENKTAVRVQTDEGYRKIYSYLGSSENAEFARLARADRIIFFEGKEKNLIRKFASKSNVDDLFQDPKTAYLQAGGFSQWVRVKEVDWALHNIFGLNVKITALFDRDYRCEEEINQFKRSLQNTDLWVDVLDRKEIENYALALNPLKRAIRKKIEARDKHITEEDIDERIVRILETFRKACHAQHLAQYLSHHREVDRHTAEPTHLERANTRFEANWETIEGRLAIIPGKEFIAVLSAELQRDFGTTITIHQIIDEMQAHDVPADLVKRLHSMADFLRR
ncbi:ATP-dependent nuclease [Neoaquamicrobium sediminum]|uniref:ATP-dependent nuclease n=1 Tax=Neoaquamicrobium sediminum TaxID=1849104 RepID=UPI0040354D07